MLTTIGLVLTSLRSCVVPNISKFNDTLDVYLLLLIDVWVAGESPNPKKSISTFDVTLTFDLPKSNRSGWEEGKVLFYFLEPMSKRLTSGDGITVADFISLFTTRGWDSVLECTFVMPIGFLTFNLSNNLLGAFF